MSSPSDPSLKPANPVVLISIDGYGLSSKAQGNAILNAKKPTMDELSKGDLSALSLFTEIDASGLSVGLPEGVMGNSEVGHLTMGAGRVSYQDLVRINKAVKEDKLGENEALQEAFQRAKKTSHGRLHLLGLVSNGGVHSHIEHIKALVKEAKKEQVPQVFLHFFADGRDTPPTSAPSFIEELQAFFKEEKIGQIATLMGRYYAMDRDKRWERIQVAFEALTEGKGAQETSQEALVEEVKKRHEKKENDEFLKPFLVEKEGLLKDDDTLLFFNFRSDRMREISSVFATLSGQINAGKSEEEQKSLPFSSSLSLNNLQVLQMTQYDEKVVLPTVFPPQTMVNGLTEWISRYNLPQFHTAETEKYAHVTFFFAGGREESFAKEERMMVPSPKVATYDLQPKMSQMAVAASVVEAIEKGSFPFILCNFAAPDMVGHTGVYEAAVLAVEECDRAIAEIREKCREKGYFLIVTADHGNAEEMEDAEGKPKTSHTTNLIPLIVCAPSKEQYEKLQWTDEVKQLQKLSQERKDGKAVPVGGLSAVAPTVLALMGLEVPKEMTGKSLVKNWRA